MTKRRRQKQSTAGHFLDVYGVDSSIEVHNGGAFDCFRNLQKNGMQEIKQDRKLSRIWQRINSSVTSEYSDRGCHYRWPGWIQRMKEAGLTRSMSKKGCSPDNAACEGFFGRLKNEMFYGRSWIGVSPDDFAQELDDYINWYNCKRIKLSLGGLSPIEYRQHLGCAV